MAHDDFIRIGAMRIRRDSIDRYFDSFPPVTPNGIIVLVTRDGDMTAFELNKTAAMEVSEYLDRTFRMKHFKEAKGAWRQFGQLVRYPDEDMPEGREEVAAEIFPETSTNNEDELLQ